MATLHFPALQLTRASPSLVIPEAVVAKLPYLQTLESYLPLKNIMTKVDYSRLWAVLSLHFS